MRGPRPLDACRSLRHTRQRRASVGMAAEAPRAAAAKPAAAVVDEHAADLLRVLLQPEAFGLRRHVCYALSAVDGLRADQLQHSLAARLGIAPETLLWSAVWPAVFGDRAKPAQIRTRLESAGAEAGLSTFNTTVQKATAIYGVLKVLLTYPHVRSRSVRQRSSQTRLTQLHTIIASQVHWVCFDAALESLPKQQHEPVSVLPQPLPLAATRDALERARRQRSLRGSGAEVQPAGLSSGGGSEDPPIQMWSPASQSETRTTRSG